MYRQNADRLFCDLLRGIGQIDRVRLIDVTKDGLCADVDHRLDAGKGGKARDKDFITRLDSLRDVKQMHRRRPRRTEHRVLHPEIRGQFALELLAFRAKDIIAALDDLKNRRSINSD